MKKVWEEQKIELIFINEIDFLLVSVENNEQSKKLIKYFTMASLQMLHNFKICNSIF